VNKILVVGGAGYIGSHMVKMLGSNGFDVVTLDNLSNGSRSAVMYGEFVRADLSDLIKLRQVFSHGFDAVMHFASYIQVGESAQKPAEYYQNNLVNTLNLLEVMREFDVSNFIFSSTAAVYGRPLMLGPISENHPLLPINVYGRTKKMVEDVLSDYHSAYGLRSVKLRYFNAAGADPEGQLGENHEPETHLIPLLLRAATGRLEEFRVFGRDYDTPDGTCIRDYVHVHDLCVAHMLALNHLLEGGESEVFNVGNGNGFSVQEVVSMVRDITKESINIVGDVRRLGDPAILVADSQKIRSMLGWVPRYPDLEQIITHAWNWEISRLLKSQIMRE
jgi:UDP-glucose 4-epimerase